MGQIEVEITKIKKKFSKEETEKLQDFEKSNTMYKQLVSNGLASYRGYCIQSSEEFLNRPDSHKIYY